MRFLQLLLLVMFFSMEALLAYDGDRSINTPDFNRENFLDLKSYEFSRRQELRWRGADNAFRVAGGSLNLDFLYSDLQIKFRKDLDERFKVQYRAEKQEFYAIKPLRHLLDVSYQVWGNWHLSLIGFPTYDKRDGDFGYGVTYGDVRRNFIRLRYLSQDVYYNDKNFEKDYYEIEPTEQEITFQHTFGPHWVNFRLNAHSYSEQFYPTEQLTFAQQGHEGKLDAEFFRNSNYGVWGVKSQFFVFEKSRLSDTPDLAEEDRQQLLEYHALDLFVDSIRDGLDAMVGARFDVFRNHLRDYYEPEASVDYLIRSSQIYAVFNHPWKPHLHVNAGLYLGDTLEDFDYLLTQQSDKTEAATESKLRLSLDWLSLSQETVARFSSTWNLDNLFGDFWDGGHMSLQTEF